MISILKIILIASLILLIKIYFFTILNIFGVLFLVIVLCLVVFAVFIFITAQRAARNKKAQDLASYGFLRDEPLAEGESLEDRVYARYIAAMTPFFSEIGALKFERPNDPAWRLKINELVAEHVRPRLSNDQYAHIVRTLEYNTRLNLISKYEEPVNKNVVARAERLSQQQALTQSLLNKRRQSSDMTPLKFEVWCRDILISQGWKAETTKASGDQGADIVAEKLGKRVVIQCKFYTGPVGNKAVQEVSTARHYYGAAYAAVICNQDLYTRGARELAASAHVKLLVADDLLRANSLFAL